MGLLQGLVVLGGRAGQRSMLKALSSTPMGAELSDSCVSAAGEVSGQLTTSGLLWSMETSSAFHCVHYLWTRQWEMVAWLAGMHNLIILPSSLLDLHKIQWSPAILTSYTKLFWLSAFHPSIWDTWNSDSRLSSLSSCAVRLRFKLPILP